MTNLRPRTGTRPSGRRAPALERQAIGFTVSLYVFICLALLAVHYAAPYLPQTDDCASSSGSPYSAC